MFRTTICCWKFCLAFSEGSRSKFFSLSFEMPAKWFEPLEDFTTPARASKLIKDNRVAHDLLERTRELTYKLRGNLDEAVLHVRGDSDYSIYTGYCGIALYYWNVHCVSGNKEAFEAAKSLVLRAVRNLNGKRISFLNGDAGPLALAALIHLQEENHPEADSVITKLLELGKRPPESAPNEILYGWAGYLYALSFVDSYHAQKIIPKEAIMRAVRNITASGYCLAQKRGVEYPPMLWEWHGKNYLGAAHGVAGILLMLLNYIDGASAHEKNELIKPTLDWLLTQRYRSGNFMSSDGSREDRLVQWCHGAPGFTSLLILASEVYNDPNYLKIAAETCDITWNCGLIKKGYSLCHGVSGNAYPFLQMYQKTKEPKYLYRAAAFLEWCLSYPKCQGLQPDRPYSLFEGVSGMLYFFNDMEKPLSAIFPGYNLNNLMN